MNIIVAIFKLTFGFIYIINAHFPINIYCRISFGIFRILQLYFGIFRLISVDCKFAYTLQIRQKIIQ